MLKLHWIKPKILVEIVDGREEIFNLYSDEKYRTGKIDDFRTFSWLNSSLIEDEPIDVESLKSTNVEIGPKKSFASHFFEGVVFGEIGPSEFSSLVSILLESQKNNRKKHRREIFSYMLEDHIDIYKTSPLDIEKVCRIYGVPHFCLTEEGECIIKHIGRVGESKLVYVVTEEGCYPIFDQKSIRKIVKRIKDSQ